MENNLKQALRTEKESQASRLEPPFFLGFQILFYRPGCEKKKKKK